MSNFTHHPPPEHQYHGFWPLGFARPLGSQSPGLYSAAPAGTFQKTPGLPASVHVEMPEFGSRDSGLCFLSSCLLVHAHAFAKPRALTELYNQFLASIIDTSSSCAYWVSILITEL